MIFKVWMVWIQIWKVWMHNLYSLLGLKEAMIQNVAYE